jgi:hypothetical protein
MNPAATAVENVESIDKLPQNITLARARQAGHDQVPRAREYTHSHANTGILDELTELYVELAQLLLVRCGRKRVKTPLLLLNPRLDPPQPPLGIVRQQLALLNLPYDASKFPGMTRIQTILLDQAA